MPFEPRFSIGSRLPHPCPGLAIRATLNAIRRARMAEPGHGQMVIRAKGSCTTCSADRRAKIKLHKIHLSRPVCTLKCADGAKLDLREAPLIVDDVHSECDSARRPGRRRDASQGTSHRPADKTRQRTVCPLPVLGQSSPVRAGRSYREFLPCPLEYGWRVLLLRLVLCWESAAWIWRLPPNPVADAHQQDLLLHLHIPYVTYQMYEDGANKTPVNLPPGVLASPSSRVYVDSRWWLTTDIDLNTGFAELFAYREDGDPPV